MSWQVQEAKQRLSEVLRAVERDGPQMITRHGEEVAVVVDVAEYRRLTGTRNSFREHLTSFPKWEPGAGETDVFDEIEAERRRHTARDIDLGLDV
jgi:prevent-host-death family protein